jgi:hypothetical protein
MHELNSSLLCILGGGLRGAKKAALLHAPLADSGRVAVDKDGLYIELRNVHYTKPEMLPLIAQEQV